MLNAVLFLACYLSMASVATARDYYVHAGKGRNSNNGTSPNSAFADLNFAVKKLAPGDVLHVRSGTYTSLPQLSPGNVKQGTSSRPILIKAYGSENPTIGVNTVMRFAGGINHWIVEGLTFNNATGVRLGSRQGSSTSKCISYAENITLRKNRFQNSSDNGVVLECARDIKIENNTFFNIRSRKVGSDRHAILMTTQASNVTISGNDFTDIGADGIQMVGNVRNIVVTNNQFKIVHPYRYRDEKGNVSSNSKQFGSVGENAIDVKGGPGPITITNNVIHGYRPVIKGKQDASGDMGVGIVLHQTSKQVFIQRNHFYDNVIHINVGPSARGAVISHNIFDNAVKANSSIYGSNTQTPKNVLINGADQVDMFNNVFHNDSGSGKILLRVEGADNLLLQNNVFRNGELLATNARYMKADHNARSGVTGEILPMFKGPRDVVSGNLRLSTSNWRPSSGSPLIDAGMPVNNTKDYYGAGVAGSAPDIGAVEFKGSVSSSGNSSSNSSPSSNSNNSGTSANDDVTTNDETYVAFVGLSDGDYVSGKINIEVEAQDPDGIKKVVFWEDDKKIGEDSSWPYKFTLNTGSFPKNTLLRLVAYGVDNKGNRTKKVVKVRKR